jgi:DNA-binding GntR family transcriptional regulator
MRSAFRRGLLASSESLSEAALTRRFGATREAVRSALRRFTEDGVLERQRRNGTWFTAEPDKILGDRMFPVINGARTEVSTLVALDESIISSSAIMREILETDALEFVRFEQLLLLRGVPTALRILYTPVTYLSGRITDMYNATAPMTGGYESDFEVLFGTKVGRITSVIEAIAAPEEIRPLDVTAGDILLSRETIAYDRDSVPRMLAYTAYKASVSAVHVTNDFTD